jgi:hypothetical protein
MPQIGGKLTPQNIDFLKALTNRLGPRSLRADILLAALRKKPYNTRINTLGISINDLKEAGVDKKIEAKKNIYNVYKNSNLFLIYNHIVQKNVQQ